MVPPVLLEFMRLFIIRESTTTNKQQQQTQTRYASATNRVALAKVCPRYDYLSIVTIRSCALKPINQLSIIIIFVLHIKIINSISL